MNEGIRAAIPASGSIGASKEHRPASHQHVGMCRGTAGWKGDAQNWMKPGSDALTGDRRGTNEEANLPLAGNDDGIGRGTGGPQLNDDDDSRRRGNRNHRVHHDA